MDLQQGPSRRRFRFGSLASDTCSASTVLLWVDRAAVTVDVIASSVVLVKQKAKEERREGRRRNGEEEDARRTARGMSSNFPLYGELFTLVRIPRRGPMQCT